MAGIKLQNFLGIAPKISAELLPTSAAQAAVNINMYSGDLLPFRGSREAGRAYQDSTVKTIYPLRDPNDSTSLKWLSWTTDVDIAVSTSLDEEEQRLYYTGDGTPKVTQYDLAVTGSGPYPVAAYDLGLPLPATVPTTSATSFTEKSSSTIARDGNGLATMVTSAAHGLTTGDKVNIAGFTYRTGTYTQATTGIVTVTLSNHGYQTGATVTVSPKYVANGVQPGSYTITRTGTNTFTFLNPTSVTSIGTATDIQVYLADLNATNVEVIVNSDTSFSYSSFGDEIASFSYSDATVNLAGLVQSRRYIYTWITPWGEESIPSDPSDALYIKEGNVVTVANLPTAKPSGNYFIRGFNLYRTVVVDVEGLNYFLLKTIYFPNALTKVARASNVATVTLEYPHNLSKGKKFKIANLVSPADFNVTDGIVLSVVDKYTFTYSNAGTDVSETSVAAGTLYWDISEPGTSTSRYYEGSTFTDDFEVSALTTTISSLYADAPDPNMQGLIMAHNNIMVGFVQNELCFSEPGKPWAWPIRYRLVFEHDIVAVAAVGGFIYVLTDAYPYRVTGATPDKMQATRYDVPMPCTSKRGVVTMQYGVLYPAFGGLAMIGPDTGAVLATKSIHDWDTWKEAYDPTDMVAEFYNGKYFCSDPASSFIFERDDQIGGLFVTSPIVFSSAYYDSRTNTFYYTQPDEDYIYEWDAADQPLLTLEWKSKVVVDKGFLNVGAARVVADFDASPEDAAALAAYNAAAIVHNEAEFALHPTLGTINGQLSYTDPVTSTYTVVDNTIGGTLVNGDKFLIYQEEPVGAYKINFRLWASKKLVADVVVDSSNVFRLPAGYKSDTFEVAVSGSARIRAIHFAETPQGLVNI